MYIKVIFTSITSLVVLFLLSKVIGNKQLTQITMFDYINSITIGSIAAEMATADKEDFVSPLIAMVIYALSVLFITVITDKSLKLRRFFNGKTITLLDDGKIYIDNLKKAKLNLNELLTEFRINGYFDISSVHSAYMEPNGMVSILPKEDCRPLTPKDMKLDIAQSKACVILILDGQILYDNLRSSSVDEKWLSGQIRAFGARGVNDVLLASLNEQKNLTVFLKTCKNPKNDFFQ